MSDKQCIFCGSRYQMAHSPDCIRYVPGTATELEQLRQDNEALKAERDRLREAISQAWKAYVYLTSNVDFADNGEASYIADIDTMKSFDTLFEAIHHEEG